MKNEKYMDMAVLVLRAVVGIILAAHGAQKVFGVFGGGGMEPFTALIENLGFTPPVVWAWTAALSELVFGVFLILGIIPRTSSAVIAVIMGVAIVRIHGAAGFFMQQGGFEYQLLILACCVSIMLTGGGKISVLDKM